MKVCRKCQTEKPAEAFRSDPRYRDGLASWCRECFKANGSAWSRQNRERLTEKAAVWRAENPEAWRGAYRRYAQANKDARAADYAEWAKANRDKRNAAHAKRRAAKKCATPPWANEAAIAAIYAEAARLQEQTGIKMHVDHIVPLQHPLICGLHCEANLRIIPATANVRKKNKWGIEEAQKQADLFIPQSDKPKPVQQSLLGDAA